MRSSCIRVGALITPCSTQLPAPAPAVLVVIEYAFKGNLLFLLSHLHLLLL